MLNLKYEISMTRNWIQRRRVKHIEPTADEIWTYIRNAWPAHSEKELEIIFQFCDKPIKERRNG